MKPIKFDLPLNSIRVATLDQLEENLTPEILQHFRSGKLAKWLRVRHLNEQADKVEALLAADIEDEVQLFKSVCEVFVGEVDVNDAREAICEYNVSIELKNTLQSKLSEESSEKFKFYDENMGFFERVALTAFAAVALPFAAVAAGDDEKTSSGGY